MPKPKPKVKPTRQARESHRQHLVVGKVSHAIEFNTEALNRRIARLEKEGTPYIDESGQWLDAGCQQVYEAIENLKKQLGQLVVK